MFLSKDYIKIRNTSNLARLGKSWNGFNFFQARNIDLWNKTMTVKEIINIGISIKELEEIKIGIGIKLLIQIE